MSRFYWTAFLGLAAQLRGALSYPTNILEGELVTRDDSDFIFAALGDSWASGVTWAPWTDYDGNKDGCLRYKYAWSTVVEGKGSDWLPNGKKAKLEFVACSGSRAENVMQQMDKTTRPKVTLMEIGGNNADFYPMADSCLFHSDKDKDYGTHFEDDNPDNPTGECRREINLVKGRVKSNDIKNKIVDVINGWRAHPANAGNDASLYLHGYPWFFADNKECDDWTFSVFYVNDTQKSKVVQGMRTEFNSLIDEMNRNIREATEVFQDSKIQYIDINPAFNNHRFCEPGSTKQDQFNWGDAVHIWNSPGKWWITIKKGNDEKMYDMLAENAEMPPWDEVEKMMNHPDGDVIQVADVISQKYRDPDDPNHSMMWGGSLNDFKALGGNSGGGSVSRTLHPTQSGHEAMGIAIVERLKRDFGSGPTPQPWGPGNCPADCDCSSGTPAC
ncbi:SGNH hydrolase-type esterase domain-containing protein [Clohesyomyces aquaticus]|uniref:SGNH hydrolase-type esterase domain-containing protein n=1 Tax=Clohesyomyces aquaticus TaxID=1231657 RepID=A0A1Y1YUN3_9PLEO|nr:SGNH hydrolase-type esterase domain-containing protein [Clohesyomyces aquaticus]